MKKLSFLIVILFYSFFAKAQDNRWKLLFQNDTSKTYVDTERTQKLPFLDAHQNVLILWIRVLPFPSQQDGHGQQTDEKMALDVANSQLALVSFIIRRDGNIIMENQIASPAWSDIYPESYGEVLLTYGKSYLKSIGE
jgi:hypothetical protein